MKNDHYDALGVPKDADTAAIKKAYRRKAQEAHPDRGGEIERFHQIQLAYEVLGDAERRAHYDKTGESGKPASIEDEIQGTLANLFERIIEMKQPPANIITEARSQAQQVQLAIQKEKLAANKELIKLEKLLGRVKAKNHNLFDGVLRQKIEVFERSIAGFERSLAVFAGVIKILDDYEDGAPEQERETFRTNVFTNGLYRY